MTIQQTPAITADADISKLVANTDVFLESMLPPMANALWDLQREPRPSIVLAISDPFRFTTGHFAPDELRSEPQVRRRFQDLIGQLLYSTRQTRIEIRDAYATADQIADFQRRLNSIPDIASKRLRLLNKVRILPDRPGSFLITEFAVEVADDVAELVRTAIRESGFNLRGDPILQRAGIRDRVLELVDKHRLDKQQTPVYAICFNLNDVSDIHLLEITNQAESIGDGTLEGIGFQAGDTIPGARSIVIYLTTPDDLRFALHANPSHPAIRCLRSQECWFVLPEDEGQNFYRDFPEFSGAAT